MLSAIQDESGDCVDDPHGAYRPGDEDGQRAIEADVLVDHFRRFLSLVFLEGRVRLGGVCAHGRHHMRCHATYGAEVLS